VSYINNNKKNSSLNIKMNYIKLSDFFGDFNGYFKAQIIADKKYLIKSNTPGVFDGFYSVIKYNKPVSYDALFLVNYLTKELKIQKSKKLYDIISNKDLIKNIYLYKDKFQNCYIYNLKNINFAVLLKLHMHEDKFIDKLPNILEQHCFNGFLLGYEIEDIFAWKINNLLYKKLNISIKGNKKLFSDLPKSIIKQYLSQAKIIYEKEFKIFVKETIPKFKKLIKNIIKTKEFKNEKKIFLQKSFLLQDFLNSK
jgi:hypothetical protein